MKRLALGLVFVLAAAGCSTPGAGEKPMPPATAAATSSPSPQGSGRSIEDIDANIDHFVNATNLLTSADGTQPTELISRFRAAIVELRTMASELDSGLPSVSTATAGKVSAAAHDLTDALETGIDCLATSGADCDDEATAASEEAHDLGMAVAALVPLGSRSSTEVMALLDGNPATETSATTGASGVTYRFDCDTGSYATYQEAWAQPVDDCDAVLVGGTPTEKQLAVVERWEERPLAKMTDKKIAKEMAYIAGYCATSGPDLYAYLKVDGVDRADQAHDLATMLEWCPDHPDGPQIRKRVAAIQRAAEGGRKIFNGGVVRVGKDIAPGTYVSRGNTESCYWERLDRNGNIIDNNLTNGSRVQVRIAESDFEFNSDGCNTWKRL